jgi:hypothetical protein
MIVSAMLAAPVQATEPAPDARPAKPLSTAVAAKLAAMPAPALKAQDPAPSAGGTDRGFFSTPKGVVAVVLMAAGLGYTVYSIKNDRDPVKSPIR